MGGGVVGPSMGGGCRIGKCQMGGVNRTGAPGVEEISYNRRPTKTTFCTSNYFIQRAYGSLFYHTGPQSWKHTDLSFYELNLTQ